MAYTCSGRRDELLNLTWADIDFEGQNVSLSRKEASDIILAWELKDHEARTVPIPPETIRLLIDMQLTTEESSPYIFVSKGRLAHILFRRAKGD